MSARTTVLVAMAIASLLAGPHVTAYAAAQEVQESKADRERRKNEERAAKRAEEQAREYAETMRDVKAELDELGASLLQALYPDDFLQDYVNELGQSLVPKETPMGTLFAFRVLHSIEPNAFALPDGRIYVTSGLLSFVENEAQMSVILGHEIAHVLEQHYVESVRQRKREQLFGTVIGAAIGAVVPRLAGGGGKASVDGALIGAAAGLLVAQVRMNSYSRKQEDEADSIGAMLALDRKYDARQAVGFFKKLTDVYGDQSRFANALYGRHSRNKERVQYIDQILSGSLGQRYNDLRAAGELSSGTGQMHMYASRMIRDVAIMMMETQDQFVVAKAHLERVAEYRSSDPRTFWALGRAYRLVGRADQDRARALDYFQRAALLDERKLYPFVHRDLGLMYARLGQTAAAVESIKTYVQTHVKRFNSHPDDLAQMYDYLLTFGDRDWIAPAVEPTFLRAAAPDGTPATSQALGPEPGTKKPPAVPAPARAVAPGAKRKPVPRQPGAERR